MIKQYIGVDPGTKGGITVLNDNGEVIDSIRLKKPTDSDVNAFLSKYSEGSYCVLEKVGAYPGQGVSSTFKFGESYGKAQGMLVAHSIPFELCTPQRWQKALSIKSKQKNETGTLWKNRLKGEAQRLFPNEKIVLENADSYLIAEYCRRKHCVNFGVK